MTTKTENKITLNDVSFNRLVFTKLGDSYEGQTRHIIGANEEEKYNSDVDSINIKETNFDEMEENFYLFANADCAFPVTWIINARTFEDAYDIYIDSNIEDLKINEEDLPDYNEDYMSYSENGIPIDTDCVQSYELKLIEATN